jgi:hypothetical protein
VIGIKKKPDTGQKKTYYTTDNFFGVTNKLKPHWSCQQGLGIKTIGM